MILGWGACRLRTSSQPRPHANTNKAAALISIAVELNRFSGTVAAARFGVGASAFFAFDVEESPVFANAAGMGVISEFLSKRVEGESADRVEGLDSGLMPGVVAITFAVLVSSLGLAAATTSGEFAVRPGALVLVGTGFSCELPRTVLGVE